MENMYFNNRKELDNYIIEHNVRNLGLGRDGVCNLLDNGYVIKKLYDDYKPKYAFQFKDFDVDSFVFAKNGVIINDYVAALFYEYAEGNSLKDNRPNNQNLLTLGTHLEKVVNDIKYISDQGVLVKDFHDGNVIYNDKNFKIIDTLPYLFIPMGNYDKENICEVMNKIYASLIDPKLKSTLLNDKYDFYGKLEFLENPKQYFEELKRFLEHITGQEINTLEDANNSVKKIKRRVL